MLCLKLSVHEEVVLRGDASVQPIVLKPYIDSNGQLKVAFDMPKDVAVTRQRAGKERADQSAEVERRERVAEGKGAE